MDGMLLGYNAAKDNSLRAAFYKHGDQIAGILCGQTTLYTPQELYRNNLIEIDRLKSYTWDADGKRDAKAIQALNAAIKREFPTVTQ